MHKRTRAVQTCVVPRSPVLVAVSQDNVVTAEDRWAISSGCSVTGGTSQFPRSDRGHPESPPTHPEPHNRSKRKVQIQFQGEVPNLSTQPDFGIQSSPKQKWVCAVGEEGVFLGTSGHLCGEAGCQLAPVQRGPPAPQPPSFVGSVMGTYNKDGRGPSWDTRRQGLRARDLAVCA